MKSVQSLSRGLLVLAAIGRYGADPARLARETGVNRATVYRILLTLEIDGYLVRSPSDHRYRLTPLVRHLSDGFTDSLWITHIALPRLMRLLQETSWPGSIATFDGRYMVFRESSHRFSSFLVHRPMIGRRIPMSTSLGQAYLAFCEETVRAPLLSALSEDWVASGYGKRRPAQLDAMLTKVRADGYATAIDALEPGVAAIARPVMRGTQVLACINVAMPPEVLATPGLLSPIRSKLGEAVADIERELAVALP